MISVPYTIKNLYHQDHCYKNIRIHFPNGERTDICNSLIVKDSVSFTESLCSQNQLKFGLCEASIFECEVVGVGNIKGATIEVSVEIEAPRTLEGVIWRSEIQKYVYPIPYGTFVVDSCKRQADMQHRKIVAYGGTANFKSSSCIYEKFYKRYFGGSVEAYTPKAFLFAIENAASSSGGIYDVTEISSVDDEFWYFNYAFVAKTNIVYHCVMNFEVKKWTFDNTSNPIADLDNLFYWTKDDINDLRAEQDKFVNYINSIARDEHSWRDFFQSNPTTLVNVKYNDKDVWSSYSNRDKPPELKTPLLVYPYFNGCKAELYFIYKYICRGYLDGAHQHIAFTYESEPFSENMSLKKMALKSEYSFLNNYRISFPVDNVIYAANPYQRPIFGNLFDGSVYNPQEVLNPAIELLGRFGTIKRDNSFELINIKRQFGLEPDTALYPGADVYPEGVTGGLLRPHEYESCWYDDDYTKPYGAIQCAYKNANNEQVNFTMYLTGFDEETNPDTYQIYDLNNNSYIQAGVWTQSDIEDFCNSIASAIEGVSYMPVDFKGLGLPYVESGDTFEILTRSNDSITTIVLNRTLTGEMTLKDTYKSV
jgi:hypothetical protein